MKASIHGTVIAQTSDDDVIAIEGNYYFPSTSLTVSVLKGSPTPYTCPWKGVARYHDVVTEKGTFTDAAWSYPTPRASAIERVGMDFSDYVAFDESQVTIQEAGKV
jgi:uncharacterized protein (DUF427 family)